MECDYHINTIFMKVLTGGNQAEGGRSRITSFPQQLCDNTSAEQTRISLPVQMLAEWCEFISTCIVLQCVKMSPNLALYLQTPPGHASATPIS
jgi:hypothetical protein